MTSSEFSRFAVVSRRTALTGALGAAFLVLAACTDDKSALSTSGSAADPSTTPPTSAGGSSASPSGASSPTAGGSGAALPASARLTVSFTFAASSSGGQVRNPYVAVWVEDAAGNLVKTIALWHEDRGGQDRWLSEMKAFSALDAADAQTVSSATRQPGSYTVQWDGSTSQGARASAGRYRLFIEAAREKGPYELVQQQIDLGSQSASFSLTPSGEITKARAEYSV